MTPTSHSLRITLLTILFLWLYGCLVARIPAQTRYPSTVREICAAHHVKYDKHTHGCYIGKDLPADKDGGTMTAEQEVIEKHPDAFYCRGFIYDKTGVGGTRIGLGMTPKDAWADALRRIKEAKSDPLQ